MEDRFWPKVEKSDGCWRWKAATNGCGYGMLWDPRMGRAVPAHRLVWEMTHGPIPEGLVIDHLCRNRLCVRPDHLEVVSYAENIRRGRASNPPLPKPTQCPRGHTYTNETAYINKAGCFVCRICDRARAHKRLANARP